MASIRQRRDETFQAFLDSKKCCCCRGCCFVELGSQLAVGLSIIWSVIAICVPFAGIPYFLFFKILNLVFLIVWCLSCILSFIALLINLHWWYNSPYLLLTSVYVIMLLANAGLGWAKVFKPGEGKSASAYDQITAVISVTMFGIQLWAVMYMCNLVYQLRKNDLVAAARDKLYKIEEEEKQEKLRKEFDGGGNKFENPSQGAVAAITNRNQVDSGNIDKGKDEVIQQKIDSAAHSSETTLDDNNPFRGG